VITALYSDSRVFSYTSFFDLKIPTIPESAPPVDSERPIAKVSKV